MVTDVSKLPQMVADCWETDRTAPDIVSAEVRAEVIRVLHEKQLTTPAADTTVVGRRKVSLTEDEAMLMKSRIELS